MKVVHCVVLILGAFGIWVADKAYDEYKAQQLAVALKVAGEAAFMSQVEDHIAFCNDAIKNQHYKPYNC